MWDILSYGFTEVCVKTLNILKILKLGWRPRRSIMLCGWDGEESGLIGSVEHVEEYYSQLHDKAIAYINIDSAVAGLFATEISMNFESCKNEPPISFLFS